MTNERDLESLGQALDRLAPPVQVEEIIRAARGRTDQHEGEVMSLPDLAESRTPAVDHLDPGRDRRAHRGRAVWLGVAAAAATIVVVALVGLSSLRGPNETRVVADPADDSTGDGAVSDDAVSDDAVSDDAVSDSEGASGDGAVAEGETEPDDKLVEPAAAAVESGPGVLTLTFVEECRNSGLVEVGTTRWNLAEAAPLSWRGAGAEWPGSVEAVDGQSAIFTAEDGTELSLTVGPTSTECIPWEED